MTPEDGTLPRRLARPLDERAGVAVGGLLTIITSYALGVVAVPAALFLLRDRLGRRAVIWGSLGSACVATVLALGSAWQWWKVNSEMVVEYPGLWSIDPNTVAIILPFLAGVLVVVLCLVGMSRHPPAIDHDASPPDPAAYQPFKGVDLAVMAAVLIYLIAVQPTWFF